MSIMRWDPMRELRHMTRRMEQLLESGPVVGNLQEPGAIAWPNVDVYEDREEIVFRAEMPGLEQKNVEVLLEDSTLTLRGERRLEREDKRENYHRIESSYGAFARSFPLPSTIDREKIRAEMHNGILEVHVPKREGARGRNIPIKT